MAGVVVGLALQRLHGELLREVAAEHAWHYRQLRELCKRLDAWYDWYGDAHLARFLYEAEVFPVVVEELRHGVVGTHVLLHLQILQVHLHVQRLLVLLGVARHAVVELLAGVLYRRAVVEEALVEAVHLLDEVGGVSVSARCGHKLTIVASLVAAQQQHVLYAQKLQVYQLVLYRLGCGAAADDVRYDGHAELVLYGGSDGYRSRTAAHAQALILSVLEFAVYVLAVMGGDIDVCRIEIAELLYCGEQTLCSCAFQRW